MPAESWGLQPWPQTGPRFQVPQVPSPAAALGLSNAVLEGALGLPPAEPRPHFLHTTGFTPEHPPGLPHGHPHANSHARFLHPTPPHVRLLLTTLRPALAFHAHSQPRPRPAQALRTCLPLLRKARLLRWHPRLPRLPHLTVQGHCLRHQPLDTHSPGPTVPSTNLVFSYFCVFFPL